MMRQTPALAAGRVLRTRAVNFLSQPRGMSLRNERRAVLGCCSRRLTRQSHARKLVPLHNQNPSLLSRTSNAAMARDAWRREQKRRSPHVSLGSQSTPCFAACSLIDRTDSSAGCSVSLFSDEKNMHDRPMRADASNEGSARQQGESVQKIHRTPG
jgi:predicted Fe-S protein YdhL (DUF1289 family)